MATSFQQQSLQRKLIYLGLVVALFTTAWLWRHHVVEKQATALALREDTRGDVELTGALVRTGLPGLRGFATCFLWMGAIDKQKKNQWNEMELLVRTLTKLQPHFVTPWLFQSWNLAYNVSVESDRVRDKYFYVSRGIQLLAAGERQNHYIPELRREMGFYHQHKICLSDENNTMRSLFQLSCIPPRDRDPDQLIDPQTKQVNWEAFVEFCKAHPQLARRLHTPPLPYDPRREYRKFSCRSAREVIAFLRENRSVPSVYVDREEDPEGFRHAKPRDNELERFPILPPQRESMFNPDDKTQESLIAEPIPDEFDAYAVARAWYGYSQEALPPMGDMPMESGPITDRTKQRLPKSMSLTIFRTAPARAQSYMAERLQEEGWYDSEKFRVTDWYKPDGSRDQPFDIGKPTEWSLNAWRDSYRMWRDFGEKTHVLLSDVDRVKKEELAQRFFERMRARGIAMAPGQQPPPLDPAQLQADPQLRLELEAAQFLVNFSMARNMTNFEHFLVKSGVESEIKPDETGKLYPRTVVARKLVYQAEQLRLARQQNEPALERYNDPRALKAWRGVLEDNPKYRADSLIQEETFEMELKYLRLYRAVHGTNLARNLALQTVVGQAAVAPPGGASWASAGLYHRSGSLPDPDIVGPLDRDSKGEPFVPDDIRQAVMIRRELKPNPPESKPPEGQPRPSSGPQP